MRKAQDGLTLQALGSNNKNLSIAVASSSSKLTKGHMVQVTINGKTLKMLLDAGSAVTLLIWNHCKNNSNTLDQWPGPKLVGVDGTPLQVMGYYKSKISLSHISVVNPVLVADSLLAQGILGLDFLQNNNIYYSVSLT